VTTAPGLDPYLLPLPAPTTPVVPARLLVPVHAHLNARYADPVWPLAPLSANPSATKRAIHWRHCPGVFQDELRLAAWTMINGELRPTYLKARGARLRSRLSPTRIGDTVACWMHLAAWLNALGITTLTACNPQMLHDYAQHLLGERPGRNNVERILGALTRLWAFDELSARPTGIGRPPWDERGAGDYLPAAGSTGGENATEPIAEQTMGPLLVWAMRMVDDFANDILAAWAETRRLTSDARSNPSTLAGQAALEAYLAPLIAASAPLPTVTHKGKTSLARSYIAGLTGASLSQVQVLVSREGLAAAAALRPGPCPLNLPVTGRIGGKPWRERLDFTEAASLMRHLGTAAFVVCGFLTGMRPGEKRAVLQQMQHSVRLINDVSAGRRGVCRGCRNVIDRSIRTACARLAPPQQCCI
jgi:hypothetical protein